MAQAQARERGALSGIRGDDKADTGRWLASRCILGLDANAPAAQLPGQVWSAVFFLEQLP